MLFNSFDIIEPYKFSFGKYKGKTIETIKDKEDALEFLKWYVKKLKKQVVNPRATKYKAYNQRGIYEISKFLNEIVKKEEIEINKIDTTNEIKGVEKEEKNEIREEVGEKEEGIKIEENLSFKQLLDIFEDKILNFYDDKFKQRKFIRSEYKDYLCLKYGNILYIDLLETQNKRVLKKIIYKI